MIFINFECRSRWSSPSSSQNIILENIEIYIECTIPILFFNWKLENIKAYNYQFKNSYCYVWVCIEFIYNSNVTKLNSNEKLESIEVTNKDGSVKTINVDGLFVAVGRIPENQNFAKLINLTESGYVKAGEDCITNVKGIFVAGDNRTNEVRQLVTATSDGAIAATNAVKYINNL